MTFDIHQLDNLAYEEAETLLDGYISDLIGQFIVSPEGQAYSAGHPDESGWVYSFLELGYNYEGLSPAQMTKADVEDMMEALLPRKITVMEISEAEAAIPELVAFWQFLSREYGLENGDAIATYLSSIKGQFGEWMTDPARGGMAKSFIMGAMQAGFDMTTQEGLNAYQAAYNAQLLAEKPSKDPFMQQMKNLIGKPELDGEASGSSKKSTSKQSKGSSKGFGGSTKKKSAKKKKRRGSGFG